MKRTKKKATKAARVTRKKKPAQSKKKAAARKPPKAARKPPKKKPAPRDDWSEVNRLQLAKLIGVHPDTVSDYSRAGMPVVTRGGAGKESVYDAVEALAWWRAQQGQNAKEAAQTRAYEAQAKLNELKIQIQNGELISRKDVVLAGQSYTKAWTAKIRALPRQMVQLGLIGRDKETSATAFLHQILTEISRWKELPS